MNRRIHVDGHQSRGGFTWKDLLVVIVVLGVLIMLLLPAISHPRETARRLQCRNNLKQIGLALHNYAQANKAFPPGTICGTDPIQPGNQYDVWSEAGQIGEGFHGTSFLLRIKPYIEGDGIAKSWAIGRAGTTAGCWSPAANVGSQEIPGPAIEDIPGFYCPNRRDSIRPMMLSPAWKGGGTDYGGCAGRHAAFTLDTSYNLCDASTYYSPSYYPKPFNAENDSEDKRWGIFGRVNVSTKFEDIKDGTSYTIMTGELQRITDTTPGSKDGWAVGGPATLFTTGAMFSYKNGKLASVDDPMKGKLMNNHFFGSPGSEHYGGAHFGLADGSVRFIPENIDPVVFALMGSMADGEKVSID